MSCTAHRFRRARLAAVAADWDSVMKTGSMRMERNATCEAESDQGARRFSHSVRRGTMER
jgi:hypothetical protein